MNQILTTISLVFLVISLLILLVFVGVAKVKKLSFKFATNIYDENYADLREEIKQKVKMVKKKFKNKEQNAELNREFKNLAKSSRHEYGVFQKDDVDLIGQNDEFIAIE
jgi:hypothetical protein